MLENISPFTAYIQSVGGSRVEISVYASNGVYYYCLSGGSAPMDGFSKTGVIPSRYIHDNCMILGDLILLLDYAHNAISMHQEDNYLIVDFNSRTVHPPEGAVCCSCGK